MQADSISRLQTMSSTVKTSSPLKGVQPPPSEIQQPQSVTNNNNLGQLDNIFQSVKRQIDQWGENAKWKIDLVLLDNPQKQQQLSNSNLHPLLSPQHLHPNAITTPSHHANTTNPIDPKPRPSLPITSNIQYPWDYTAPSNNDWRNDTEALELKLRECIERQQYLESIIWSQAEQIKHSHVSPENEYTINTMKNIFLMTQNEQKAQYLMESNMLHKDIETLSKKLKKMASILETIEKIDMSAEDSQLDKEALLQDRKLLLKKLHLADLRLSARDAEIEYLQQTIETLKSNQHQSPKMHPHPFTKKLRKGQPYLFQQQYSPRSEVRSSEQHPLSGLDSLGIVADQMLSDPEFEGPSSSHPVAEKRLRSRLDDRRSQRSIDSAATLLAMPQLMSPHRTVKLETRSDTSSPPLSPEQHPQPLQKPNYDHIPKKPRSTYTRWTEAEDKLLRAAVKKYGFSNWEACSKDVHGRSNIQCRNRWIRHLEQRPPPVEEEEEEEGEEEPIVKGHVQNARQSPSIAALLNNDNDAGYRYSPRPYDQSSYLHPTYRPPSPIATPKNGKRRAPEDPMHKW